MEKKTYPELEHRLSKAKTALIFDHPFVASIAMSMPTIITEDIPTAATNGRYIKFNPNFAASLSDAELVFLMAHECFHPLLEHCIRKGDRNHMLWNIAGDFVINELLVGDNIGSMPAGGCKDTHIYTAGGGTTTGVYDYLYKESEKQDGSGRGIPGAGDYWEDVEDAGGTEAEREQMAAELKVKVAQAAQSAKMMGKLSAGMERLVGELLNPKVDWREVLKRFLVKCRTDERTWRRPNRRFAHQGIYMPSVGGEAMGELLVAVDCSGSITDDVLNQFAAEIRAIHEDMKPTKLTVMYFDSRISHVEEYGPQDTLDIRAHGGGGTAFSPIFREAMERSIDPVACVVLTDLYCSDFGPQPDYPVMWVSYGAETAPWGEVVMF